MKDWERLNERRKQWEKKENKVRSAVLTVWNVREETNVASLCSHTNTSAHLHTLCQMFFSQWGVLHQHTQAEALLWLLELHLSWMHLPSFNIFWVKSRSLQLSLYIHVKKVCSRVIQWSEQTLSIIYFLHNSMKHKSLLMCPDWIKPQTAHSPIHHKWRPCFCASDGKTLQKFFIHIQPTQYRSQSIVGTRCCTDDKDLPPIPPPEWCLTLCLLFDQREDQSCLKASVTVMFQLQFNIWSTMSDDLLIIQESSTSPFLLACLQHH